MLNGCAYILTVDVGNTFIRFGLFAEDSAAAQECPLATCEITTPSSITADEARMRLAQVMAALAADAGMPGALVPTAAVLSCVVPALERPWKTALSRTCTGRVLTVGPGLKTGMPVHYDDPAEIGPDRIADAVAARAVYGSPCIVIDLGTTTNIEAIDARGTFVGGVIAPGLALGARSLSAAAARLPQVEPSAPTHVIGRNTREAMRSGVVLGEVARIDGMLDMVLAEMRAGVPEPDDTRDQGRVGGRRAHRHYRRRCRGTRVAGRSQSDGRRRADAAGSRRALPHQPKAPPRVKVRAPVGQTPPPFTCYNRSNYCDYGGVCHVGRSSSNFVRQAPGRH